MSNRRVQNRRTPWSLGTQGKGVKKQTHVGRK